MDKREQARAEIDRIDKEMAQLFEARMKAVEGIAEYKKEHGLPIRDPVREQSLIKRCTKEITDPAIVPYYRTFLKNTIDVSCSYQQSLLSDGKTSDTENIGSILPVKTAAGGYEIVLSRGALADAGCILNLDRKVLIVTDSGVPAEYADRIEQAAKQPYRVVIKQGEGSKTTENLEFLLHEMLRCGFSRGDCVCAVGGGVVGDLSGFAAACYMRGIAFYNVPTTLLSQLDSSVGGKTAVDLDGVKNVIGAFKQPDRVLIDPDTLRTLDKRQLRAGLAEAVKMAAVWDKELFSMLETCSDLSGMFPEIIRRSLLIKIRVVEEDPEEKNLRRVLNFGHTIGHAIEALHGGELLHGECVGLGMLPMCAPSVQSRIRGLLEKFGLPSKITDTPESLLPYLVHDKKKNAEGILTVQVDAIGSYRFREMTSAEILARMEMCI